jgi:hypothetical protein
MRREYENNILGFVEECDRRIRAAQKRLEKTPEENNRTTALVSMLWRLPLGKEYLLTIRRNPQSDVVSLDA